MTDCEIAVAGGGPAGLAAALALARAGLRIALVAPPHADDGRTAALLQGSVRFLERLGVWPALAGAAEKLQVMEIVDMTGRLVRAPTVRFEAAEIGLDAFGFNIPNAAIVAALADAARSEPNLVRVEGRVARVEVAEAGVTLFAGSGGAVRARAAVAADGQRSLLRRAAGIEADRWSYPQTALVLNLSHDRPHGQVSTELHYPVGPFTLVPLPGRRSSLVWVDAPERAARRAEEDDAALARDIEERAQGIRGRVRIDSRRWLHPLQGLLARRLAAGPVALVGEAAHAFPPIAAQGLNLGLRDAAALAGILAAAPGDFNTALTAYDRQRRADVFGRTFAVHVLNRSLLGSLLPLQLSRAAGLGLLRAAPALRRAIMRAGIEP